MSEFTKARYAALDVISRIEAALNAVDELHQYVLDLPQDDERLASYGRGKYFIADEVQDLARALNGPDGKLLAERIRGRL